MPLYFFHVDNGTFAPDLTGSELLDLQAARVEAVRAAGDMINNTRDTFWNHKEPWSMHVTDDASRLLFTLQFNAKVASGEVFLTPGLEPD